MLARLSAPRATIISIDLPGGKFGRTEQDPLFALSCVRQIVSEHARDSWRFSLEEVSARVKHITQSLDVLFIDGDHTYEGVKDDFLSYSPLIRRGGIVAFHDIAEHPEKAGGDVPASGMN